jgi:ribonuclease HII
LLRIERSLQAHEHNLIAGLDEVGRGCLAGPLVAAAVVLPLDSATLPAELEGVRDSKDLLPAEREELYSVIVRVAVAIGLGWSSEREVDRLGLAAANRTAMTRALAALSARPDALIVDFLRLPGCSQIQYCLPHADSLSLSVASASIVAKVVRDRWMVRYDARFPQYGFAEHKGYGTRRHLEALRSHGPCPLHRRSFAPVALAPS